MTAKRALIVDDSKSARLFLARMLEKYGIDVDDAETAEAAIDYLASHRPDVIFMDHLMPGMDGFQAVQAIKNNPLTATIPILMYTSQEGELYLGQARALGALGVLPKQIKPADVSKVLYQLHLLTDRRTPHQSSFQTVNLPPGPAAAEGAANDSAVLPAVLTETALREQFAELRRALVAGVDTQTERITAEVRALLLEAFPPVVQGEEATQPPPPAAQGPQWGWLVASIALAIALASTALWWRQSGQLQSLNEEMRELRLALGAQRGAPRAGTGAAAGATSSAANGAASGAGAATGLEGGASALQPAAAGGASPAGVVSLTLPTDAHPLIIQVPYGAEPLAGPRQESIRVLLERMVKDNRAGVLDIRTYAGRYCLIGNNIDGYSPAPDELPFGKCDLIGNPPEEALSAAQRVPLPFANMIAGFRHASHGSLEIQAGAGDSNTILQPYPPTGGDLTSGEWNRAANANNRIEIRVR
ncbi:MAG: response regulator [Sinobacteraceae bacterium]|nr:response regulator [Nevskiaceae bacterium]